VRAVRHVLSVSRSHVLAKRDLPSELTDLRKSPPRNDDVAVKKNHCKCGQGLSNLWLPSCLGSLATRRARLSQPQPGLPGNA
jgi:hypothetical protein